MKRQCERKIQEAREYVDFRQRKQAEQLKTKFQSDLKRSKLACHQLDKKCGYTSPVLDWYWPEELIPKEEVESGSDSDSDSDVKEDETEVW